jgi:hypothetical protein
VELGAAASRPRLPRSLARRIDRSSRRVHAGSRFAHHPLCERYAGELIAVRRHRICRGCACAAVGGLAGLLGGAVLVVPPLVAWVALALGLGLAAWGGPRRLPKVVGRLLPALLVTLAAVRLWQAALVAALMVGGFLVRYRHRGPDRMPCSSCPERGATVCSGFAPLVRRERAWQRLVGRWIMEARRGAEPRNALSPEM